MIPREPPGFLHQQSLTFKLLADTEKKVTTEYGSLSEKGYASRNTFLFDPHGKIVEVWTSENHKNTAMKF